MRSLIDVYETVAPKIKKNIPSSRPHWFIVYGRERTPAPMAVEIRVKILPLMDPGVSAPNHLDQQLLS